jgi:hypothetical protein
VDYLRSGTIKTLLPQYFPVTIEGNMLLYVIGQDITGPAENEKNYGRARINTAVSSYSQ